MAKKKAKAIEDQPAEQQAPAASRFVDVVVEEREVPVRLSDARLLEIADEACSKHRASAELHVEIKAFSDSRKALIKTLDDEAAELDEQFYRKTVPATKEVRIIKDFAQGRLRVEVIETGEVVEDREFGASECQRDFASMLESDPSDQFLQRAVDVIRQHLEQQTDPQEFADIVAETLGVSVSFGERIIGLLKGKVLVGDGTDTDPMTIVDVSRKCEDCRHYPEMEGREECSKCEYEDGLPGFEKLDKCSGCQFRRNLMTFKPCAGCDPADEAAGFVSLVD